MWFHGMCEIKSTSVYPTNPSSILDYTCMYVQAFITPPSVEFAVLEFNLNRPYVSLIHSKHRTYLNRSYGCISSYLYSDFFPDWTCFFSFFKPFETNFPPPGKKSGYTSILLVAVYGNQISKYFSIILFKKTLWSKTLIDNHISWCRII